MIAILNFALLVVTTMFAVAAAVGLLWLFLRATYVLMQPATARRLSVRTELARGVAQLARAYSSNH